MNLIPSPRKTTFNYWCTWDTQWNVLKENTPPGHPIPTHDRMDEAFLFGPDGVFHAFDAARGDLIALLDNGWDVPYGAADGRLFGSLEVDAGRFPSLQGTPAQRLRALSDRVRALGYRGLGLWVPAQMPGDNGAGPGWERARAHWDERARWSHEAGVLYWKVDWGVHSRNIAYREMMTDCARRYAPGLIVEHALCQGPFEPDCANPIALAGREEYIRQVLQAGDVLRTYDIAPEFTHATTMYRAAEALRLSGGSGAVINVEDDAILGAGLGCSLGVMRHPKEADMVRLTYPSRIAEESVRALHWHRVAPPFPAGDTPFAISGQQLEDAWYYPKRDKSLWPCTCDEIVRQSAPSAVSRNMALPVVEAEGEKPFVASSLHPDTGALSLAALPRTLPGHLCETPLARVAVCGAQAEAPVGLFGHFGAVEITFMEEIGARRVFAQDLCREEAVDVTADVRLEGKTLFLPGSVLEALCRLEGRERALPGAMLVLRA